MNYKKYSRDIKLTKLLGDDKLPPQVKSMKNFFDNIFKDILIKHNDITGKISYYKLDYYNKKEKIYVEYYPDLKKVKYSMRFLNAVPFLNENCDDFMVNLLKEYIVSDIKEAELLL
jgi:hypothetical protein